MTTACDRLIAEILDAIAKRYVMNDSAIPSKVLKLKDEVMGIYAKLHSDKSGDTGEYERRLIGIKETLN